MGFPRQEYWLPFPSPGDLPIPGMELTSLLFPALAGDSLPLGHPGSHIKAYFGLTSLYSITSWNDTELLNWTDLLPGLTGWVSGIWAGLLITQLLICETSREVSDGINEGIWSIPLWSLCSEFSLSAYKGKFPKELNFHKPLAPGNHNQGRLTPVTGDEKLAPGQEII